MLNYYFKEDEIVKEKLKTFAVWLILGIIFIVLLSSVIDNSNTKMIYSELIAKMESGAKTSICFEKSSIIEFSLSETVITLHSVRIILIGIV